MKDGFVKVAAGVPEIALGDCERNAERIVAMALEMNATGVKLAVFTELGITGYTLEDLFLQQTLLSAAECRETCGYRCRKSPCARCRGNRGT